MSTSVLYSIDSRSSRLSKLSDYLEFHQIVSLSAWNTRWLWNNAHQIARTHRATRTRSDGHDIAEASILSTYGKCETNFPGWISQAQSWQNTLRRSDIVDNHLDLPWLDRWVDPPNFPIHRSTLSISCSKSRWLRTVRKGRRTAWCVRGGRDMSKGLRCILFWWGEST